MKKKDPGLRLFRRLLLSAFVLSLPALFLLGCGRKGDPVPDHSIDSFSFSNIASAVSPGGLLTVKGSLEGAAVNMECLLLEVQPVTDELCEGCPFLPVDQKRFEASDATPGGDIRTFDISYRPFITAGAYRWRLSGVNIHSGVPPVQTEVMTTGDSPLHREIPVPVMGTDELGDILAREKALPEPAKVEDSAGL